MGRKVRLLPSESAVKHACYVPGNGSRDMHGHESQGEMYICTADVHWNCCAGDSGCGRPPHAKPADFLDICTLPYIHETGSLGRPG
jgi:hypothetical protein